MAEKVKTESLLENIFDASPNAITVTDLNGNITECNQATLDMHGYSSKEELIGKSAFELIAKRDHERAIENMRKTLEQGSVHNIEYTFLTKDRREFPAELSVSVVRDGSGNPTGFVAITKDITECKQVEEALRESEEKFRSIFESANDCIAYLDRSGRIFDVNRKAVEVFGGSKKELLGKHFTKLGILSPRDIPKTLGAFAMALTGKKTTYATYIKNKKGREMYVEVSGSLTKIDDKFAGMLVIARDVTERKKMEEQLKESEEKFRSIFENGNDIITYVDKHGKILDVNRRIEDALGYKRDEIIGKNFAKLGVIGLKDLPRILKLFISTIRNSKPEKLVELELKHKKGNKVFVEVGTSFIKKNGKVENVVNIFRDITERKRMEDEIRRYSESLEELVNERTRELKEAQERLLKAERLAAIGEVAGTVGHDLRNPLQAIVNTSYLAKKKLESMSCPLVEKQGLQELYGKIGEQVEYMNKIVSDLQDYARHVKPELVETSLHQLINDTLSTITVPEKVKVSIKIEDSFKVMADPTLMKRVFTNLITNALQAMPDGGKLTLRSSKTKEATFISIQDTGVGIPKENLPKLFQPLFTTKSKGTGFGLPVCKRLVEAHDGIIIVESKVGMGSTFTVKLPLRREVS